MIRIEYSVGNRERKRPEDGCSHYFSENRLEFNICRRNAIRVIKVIDSSIIQCNSAKGFFKQIFLIHSFGACFILLNGSNYLDKWLVSTLCMKRPDFWPFGPEDVIVSLKYPCPLCDDPLLSELCFTVRLPGLLKWPPFVICDFIEVTRNFKDCFKAYYIITYNITR